MSRRGTKGAFARDRKIFRLAPDELGPLESPADAARWLSQVALAVATGRLGAQEASVIQRCVTTWLNSREMWAPPEELPALRVILSDGENEWDAAEWEEKRARERERDHGNPAEDD
jgi:hypothetical protein